MDEQRPDWASCVAEGHWTQIIDSKTQIVELVHDPDDGPCEWQVTEDQQRWSAKEIKRNDRMGVATIELSYGGKSRTVTWMAPNEEIAAFIDQVNNGGTDRRALAILSDIIATPAVRVGEPKTEFDDAMEELRPLATKDTWSFALGLDRLQRVFEIYDARLTVAAGSEGTTREPEPEWRCNARSKDSGTCSPTDGRIPAAEGDET